MTREEFEEWLEEHKDEALDNCGHADASAQKWLVRLYAHLKAIADADDNVDDDDSGGEIDEEEGM
jgi:hypothetical protein